MVRYLLDSMKVHEFNSVGQHRKRVYLLVDFLIKTLRNSFPLGGSLIGPLFLFCRLFWALAFSSLTLKTLSTLFDEIVSIQKASSAKATPRKRKEELIFLMNYSKTGIFTMTFFTIFLTLKSVERKDRDKEQIPPKTATADLRIDPKLTSWSVRAEANRRCANHLPTLNNEILCLVEFYPL